MNAFEKVINKDPQVRIKVNNKLDRYNKLPYNYQSKIGYGFLFQNVILKEFIKIRGTTIKNLDIE